MHGKIIFRISLILMVVFVGMFSGCIFENQPPQASFTVSPPLILKDTLFYCNSTATDPDGTIVNYSWYINEDLIGHSKYFSYMISENGSYTIQLMVKDNGGLTDSYNLSVIIGYTDDIISRFFGSWEWTGNNQTGLWTFYQNNTLKATFQGLSASVTNWWHYNLNGSEICFSEPDNPRLISGCYIYNFNAKYTELTVSYSGNTETWYRKN